MAGSNEGSASWSGRDHRLPANASRAWSNRDILTDPEPTLSHLSRVESSPAATATTDPNIDPEARGLGPRRYSVNERLSAWGNIGGVNSFNNFARSWTRAAGFHEFTDARQSFRVQPDTEESGDDAISGSSHSHSSERGQRSLLRAALQNDSRNVSESALDDDVSASLLDPSSAAGSSIERRIRRRRASMQQEGVLQLDPALETYQPGSYGSFLSRRSASSLRPSRTVIAPAQSGDITQIVNEEQPLINKVEEGVLHENFNIVVGKSTVPQTIFNSVNTLIGVGMLSLPLALRYSGWVFGLGFFLVASVATSYTAKLLAKCMNVDGSLITFADLAYISFGRNARVATSILFCMELIASCVALTMLFADSMHALFESMSVFHFKLICGVILVPLAFVPLRFLSLSSVLGILCGAIIVVGVLADGLVKTEAPGSLRDPAHTFAFPADWRSLPLAFGLLMAPWGGHGVFPNIYRDMRHPQRYGTAVNTTYLFTFSTEVVITVAGYMMFGDDVHDEITSNIFLTPGYPRWLSYVIAIAICIIPLTKAPLNARPIYSTVEFFLGLNERRPSHIMTIAGEKRANAARNILAIATRLVITALFVLLAILVPSFDRVMALLGSLACSLVCIVLPCSFHLKIFGSQLSLRQKLLDWVLIVLFLTLGVAGTVAACMPKRLLGIKD